jgi:hypothetical protein
MDHKKSIQSIINKWSKLVYCVPSKSEEHAKRQARASLEEHLESEGLEMEWIQ